MIGQGYVGLPVAHAAVRAGHTVVGYDVDERKISDLRRGCSPIEDISDSDLAGMLDTGRYLPADSASALGGCSTFIVTVPTPLSDGRPDLTAVLAAARAIGPHLRDGDLVVLESTVAPGTTRGAFRDALATTADVHVAFSPERIDPGNSAWRFTNTPKIVGGLDTASGKTARAFYEGICDTIVPVDTAEEAETAKLLENTYRYVNIALVNELGRHTHELGINVWNVIRAAATKPYGFQPFFPGPGVGGHCLPIDPEYLADAVQREVGTGFEFVRLAMQINRAQPAYVVQRITELLNAERHTVNGCGILVVGAAYKPDTGDLRESPAVEVTSRLAALGADVTVYEPHAGNGAHHLLAAATAGAAGRGTVGIVDSRERLAGMLATPGRFELAVILTDHSAVPYDAVVRAVPRVLDTRGALAPHPAVTTL
ncbi:nucleotide sugar dehydrogenase [Actinoplanes sp. NPDC026623]|uniref:nucleotide sugar dehydrogenase n=1 Tax=Actinoplanes sp. NPDC026623 TaxID=3155610 RepID=UPI0033E8EB52